MCLLSNYPGNMPGVYLCLADRERPFNCQCNVMPFREKGAFPTASQRGRGPPLSKQDAGHILSRQSIKPDLHTLRLCSVWPKQTIQLAQRVREGVTGLEDNRRCNHAEA